MSSEYLHDLFGLDGQTAVVIGGGGVLGGALCRGLAAAGAHVVVADVAQEACKARVAEIEQFGGKASWALVDVTKRESIESLLEEAKKPTGRCDILVNAAGVNNGTPFLEHTEEWWDRVMAINLKGTFLACQVFGAHMVERGEGAIVNIGSVTSHLPLSRVFGYAASKAGVLSLTRNVADDFGTTGVRVNCICPGFFPAEQNRKLLTQERTDRIIQGTPMRRFGEPEELIGALLLLVSKKAGGFITGTSVNVDGGFMAAWL
ncbi:MAG TPA: gluconate 5-dehydrogenase [Planctomycetaceae bacterium]|nr:gluconate 5-dehydrogenase [Planctomycetaceae bacterium]